VKILDIKQGSDEWLTARLGLVTASELDALITPGWKVKDMDSAGPRTYLFKKIAEAWLGRPVNQFGSFAMEQGQIIEPEARPWFELAHDCEVSTDAGFIIGDDGRCGCSPDGLIACSVCSGKGGWSNPDDDPNGPWDECANCFGTGFATGLEIKCPQETNAVRYALDGELPSDYELQVHGSLFVTGFARWHFLSYSRHLPKFHTIVERDESKCAKIAEALAAFYEAFDEAWEKLNAVADEPRKNPFAK